MQNKMLLAIDELLFTENFSFVKMPLVVSYLHNKFQYS